MKLVFVSLMAVSLLAQVTHNGDLTVQGKLAVGGAATWASAYKPTFNSGGTTTCDLSKSNLCEVDFGAGNTTLALSNPTGSGPYLLRSCEDGVGGRGYTAFPGTAKGFAQPDPGANNCTEQTFSYDGTNYQGGAVTCPLCTWHGLSSTEGSALAGVAGVDQLYADSSAHRWKMNNNNGGPDYVVGAASPDTLTNKTLSAPVVTGLADVSGGNFKGPIGAGFTSTSSNTFGFDSTNSNWHLWNGSDLIVGLLSGAITTGHCPQFFVTSSKVSIVDSGSANCGGGGSTAWSAIGNPSGNLSLTMAANTSTFTHNATTGAAADMWTWTDTASNTGTGYMLKVNLASGSAMKPFYAAVNGNGVTVSNTGVLAKLGTGHVNADQFNGNTAIAVTDLAASTIATGTSVSLTAPRQYYVCTSTCTVTPPVPAAGYEFCVRNANNVSTVITLAALGSSARYENTANTAYGTAGTGTFVSGGAAGDKVCIVGLDSTHYLTLSSSGTWTAN